MFSLNDKVVYPGHGVAKINRIIEKIIAGTVSKFFELKFLNKEMTILVPVCNVDSIGLRSLASQESINDIYKLLAQPTRRLAVHELTASSWNKRNKEYQLKLRTGDLRDLSEIYRDLKYISLQKELSFGEKSLLQQTEALIVEEISIVKKLGEDMAMQDLRSIFTEVQSATFAQNKI